MFAIHRGKAAIVGTDQRDCDRKAGDDRNGIDHKLLQQWPVFHADPDDEKRGNDGVKQHMQQEASRYQMARLGFCRCKRCLDHVPVDNRAESIRKIRPAGGDPYREKENGLDDIFCGESHQHCDMDEEDGHRRDNQLLRMIGKIGDQPVPERSVGEGQEIDRGQDAKRTAGNGRAWKSHS